MQTIDTINVLVQNSSLKPILEQFYVVYDLTLQVETPMIRYNGQKLINEVSTKIPEITMSTIPNVPVIKCVK